MFIFHLLANQETHTGFIILAHMSPNQINTAVFTAKTKQQHTANVGMRSQICKNLTGMFLIIAHL